MTGETLYLVTRTATWGGSLVSTETVLLIVTMKALIQESAELEVSSENSKDFLSGNHDNSQDSTIQLGLQITNSISIRIMIHELQQYKIRFIFPKVSSIFTGPRCYQDKMINWPTSWISFSLWEAENFFGFWFWLKLTFQTVWNINHLDEFISIQRWEQRSDETVNLWCGCKK